jgi:hypothetical protein
MQELGTPLHASAVSKIEKRDRRVDVDDLLALAVALRTTPNRLLLAGNADDALIRLAPELEVPSARAWRWAVGEQSLAGLDHGFTEAGRESERTFRKENRPQDGDVDFAALVDLINEHPDLGLTMARLIVEAKRRDITLTQLHAMLQFTSVLPLPDPQE